VHEVRPARGPCGNTTFALTKPSHTHHVIDLPPITMDVTHWGWPQSWCAVGGTWQKAQGPTAHATGYGPRCRARRGAVAGTSGHGRRMGQTLCASVLPIPLSLGASQQVRDRVAHALEPPDSAMATQARQARVHSLDDTPWLLPNTRQGLWVRVSATAALSLRHPRRSTEAFGALIDDWAGILGSDGDGVYQNWVQARHTCMAHLIRSARGVAARAQPDLAARGTWA
jgi:transposase